jgi:hypothetical protein
LHKETEATDNRTLRVLRLCPVLLQMLPHLLSLQDLLVQRLLLRSHQTELRALGCLHSTLDSLHQGTTFRGQEAKHFRCLELIRLSFPRTLTSLRRRNICQRQHRLPRWTLQSTRCLLRLEWTQRFHLLLYITAAVMAQWRRRHRARQSPVYNHHPDRQHPALQLRTTLEEPSTPF